MKNRNALTRLLFAVLIVALLLSPCAQAAGHIDLTRDCSLTISFVDQGTPLSGADFSLYLAATVDATGKLTPTESFSRFPVRFQNTSNDSGLDSWSALASTLEGYVLYHDLPPTTTGATDGRGLLTFHDLTPGFYLVLSERCRRANQVYDAQPFLVMLPTLDKDSSEWNYQMAVSLKYEKHSNNFGHPRPISRKVLKVWQDEGHEHQRPQEITVQLLRDGKRYDTVVLNEANNWRYAWNELDSKYRWNLVEEAGENYTVQITREGLTFLLTNTWEEPDSPSPTEPDSSNPPHPSDPSTPSTPTTPGKPELPYTGQLWWPVPLLLCAGLFFLVVGVIRRKRSVK